MLSINPDIELIHASDDSLVIFDPSTGTAHFLDETGTDIIELLRDSAKSREDLVDALLDRYNAPRDVIERDVGVFLQKMADNNIVVESML